MKPPKALFMPGFKEVGMTHERCDLGKTGPGLWGSSAVCLSRFFPPWVGAFHPPRDVAELIGNERTDFILARSYV